MVIFWGQHRFGPVPKNADPASPVNLMSLDFFQHVSVPKKLPFISAILNESERYF